MESFDLKMKNFVTLNFGIKRLIYIKIYQIEKKQIYNLNFIFKKK